MTSLFHLAGKKALESAGVKTAETWHKTKKQVLGQARAQLARRDIRPETAARWNHRAWVVAADLGRDARIDPRLTAVRKNGRR